MNEFPRRGDKAFASVGGDIWHGFDALRLAGLERSYIKGFKRGADSLIAVAVLEPTFDERVIPACQLYRHYVELQLKDLLLAGRSIGHVRFRDADIEIHGLYPLWNLAKAMILHIEPTESPDDLSATEALMQEIHSVDRSGQELRYPRRSDGQPSLASMPPLLDLHNLKDKMRKVENYLDHWSTILDSQFDDPDFAARYPAKGLTASRQPSDVSAS